MKRILTIEVGLAIACVTLTALLFNRPYILTALLAGIGIVFLYRSTSKNAYHIFIGAGLGGAISEMIAIYAGAWTYTVPQMILIPLWLPLLWGNAALFIVAMSMMDSK